MVKALNGDASGATSNGMFSKTFLVRGNHDDHYSNPADWQNYLVQANRPPVPGATNYTGMNAGSTYLTYAFDYENARFIGLDVPGSVGNLSDAQITWLDQILTEAETNHPELQHAFVFFHGPLYCIGQHCSCTAINDPHCIPSSTASLISVFNRHPIVSATFHGHEHDLTWTHIDSRRITGVTHAFEQFVTSPSGSSSYDSGLHPQRVDYAAMINTRGFATIDVSGPEFTVSFYKIGVSSPVWSKTFSKSKSVTRDACVYVLLTVLQPTATGRLYYVSPNGDDAWPGTLDQPFKTINKGSSVLAAGDTLYVRGGTYQETVRIEKSGTAAAPIRVLAYPGETPIVDGNNYALPTAEWGVLFGVYGDYVQVAGFEVRYSNWQGFTLYGQHDSADQMNVHHIKENGMRVAGDYGLIEDSQVWRTCLSNSPEGPYRGGWASGLSAARDQVDGVTAGAILRRNVVHDTYGEGLSSYEATGTIIEGNTVYDNQTNVYVSDSQDVLVRGNLVYYTAGNSIPGDRAGIMLGDEKLVPRSQNIAIVNNLAYGNSSNFFWWQRVDEGMINILVANNTFVNATGEHGWANLQIRPGPHQAVRIMNNIIEQDDAVPIARVPDSPAGLSFSNNLWSMAPPSVATGEGDVLGNPLLVKGATMTADWFVPQASSPAIDRGRVLAEVTVDYLGRPRGALPDIGAYELQ